MTGQPSGELVLILDLDQVHGALFVDLGQGEEMRGGGRIGGIDPVDEGRVAPAPPTFTGSLAGTAYCSQRDFVAT